MNLSAEDKRVIRQIQGDLPIVLTPFTALARGAGLSEGEFLGRIRGLMRRRMIRRFGAILRHQIAGFKGNAMVVWRVPEDRIDETARIMTSYPAVSHCYLRPLQRKWPYNLYSMIHGRSDRDCRLLAKRLSRETGLRNFRILFSKRELKKSSMRYFEED
jgi:siroheme decarboxylase